MGKGARVRNARKIVTASTFSWERLMESWLDNLSPPSDSRVLELIRATYLSVMSLDPDTRGVDHCLAACVFMQRMLELRGYAVEIVVVKASILDANLQLMETVGSSAPRLHSGNNWSGHAVIVDHETGFLVDPTIGQATSATTDDRKVPLMMCVPGYFEAYRAGIVAPIRRENNYLIHYEPISVEVPVIELERESVYEAVDRVLRKMSE